MQSWGELIRFSLEDLSGESNNLIGRYVDQMSEGGRSDATQRGLTSSRPSLPISMTFSSRIWSPLPAKKAITQSEGISS